MPAGQMSVSQSWLLAVFISLGQDFFLIGTIVCAIKTYVLCLLASRQVWQSGKTLDSPTPTARERIRSGTARVQATFMLDGPVGACLNPILRALCTGTVGEADEEPDAYLARVVALEVSRLGHFFFFCDSLYLVIQVV